MTATAQSLSRLARGLLLVAIFLPGGTVDLLPYALAGSCSHECCRKTDACHRRPPSRATEGRGETSPDVARLSARHVLASRCRDLCGLQQTTSASVLAPSVGSAELSPPPRQAFPIPADAPFFEDEGCVASPRGPPSSFSEPSI